MMPSVTQAVQTCHELLLWLIPQLDKFPRVRRFSGRGIQKKAWRLFLMGERIGTLNEEDA